MYIYIYIYHAYIYVYMYIVYHVYYIIIYTQNTHIPDYKKIVKQFFVIYF